MIASIILLILYIVFPDPASAQSTPTPDQNRVLDSLRSELNYIRSQLESERGQEYDVLGQLNIRQKQVSVQEALIREQQTRAGVLRDSIANLESDIEVRESYLSQLGLQIIDLEDRHDLLSEGLARTLLADRRLAQFGAMEFMLGARSWRDLMSRRAVVKRLESIERNALNSLAIAADTLQTTESYVFTESRTLRAQKDLLELRRAEALELEHGLTVENAKLDQGKQQLVAELDRIQNNRKLLEERSREIETAQAAIKGMIEKVVRGEPMTGISLLLSRGVLPWPANGRVVQRFGLVKNEALSTFTENPGIEILVSADEPIKCIAEGKVSSITWLRGFGNVCIVEHPGSFFTVYARLGQIDVTTNQTVATGQSLGYTSFDPVSEQYRLHFEFWSGKDKKDPLEWLSSR